MAPEDLKAKKRKGATDAAPKPKKQKKLDETAIATKKSAKALNAAVKPIDDVDVNVKVSRKRAADFFDEYAPVEDKTKVKKGSKKSKTVAEVNGDEDDTPNGQTDKEKAKKPKKAPTPFAKLTDAKKAKKVESHSKRIKSFKEQPEIDNAEEDDEDDQTAALLAGFESDNDEDDPEEDVELDTEVKAKIDPKVHSQLEKASQRTDEPGVIYVGRIPHGFYEPQMKAYFKQFGNINRLRVSRNKKTGAVKHYAFVEFASAEVADIVARTMNNYLMFGHILQCRVVPTAQVHPDLFKGAGERFKRDPRNKKEGAAMEHGAERAVWEKRVINEQKKRAGKSKALKEEMDYEYTAPPLKAAADVPKSVTSTEDSPTKQLLAEASAANSNIDVLLSEANPVQSDAIETPLKVKEKKPRKAAKSKNQNGETEAISDTTNAIILENGDALTDVKRKKPKERSKSKSNVTAGTEAVIEDVDINTATNKSETETLPKSSEATKEKKSRNRKQKAVADPETKTDTIEIVDEASVKEKNPVVDTTLETPVPSLTGDTAKKANASTKKAKAVKKNKQSLPTEVHEEETLVKTTTADVDGKAKAGTKRARVKKAKVSNT